MRWALIYGGPVGVRLRAVLLRWTLPRCLHCRSVTASRRDRFCDDQCESLFSEWRNLSGF